MESKTQPDVDPFDDLPPAADDSSPAFPPPSPRQQQKDRLFVGRYKSGKPKPLTDVERWLDARQRGYEESRRIREDLRPSTGQRGKAYDYDD